MFQSQFVRLKNTVDGWRPRARTELHGKFSGLKSDCVGMVMDLIGMDVFGGGLTVCTPGIKITDGVAYLTVPSRITPKGCKRISDVAYEKKAKRVK